MNRNTILNKCIAGIISHEIGEKEIDLIFKVLDKFEQVELALAGAASNVVNYTATREQDINAATEELNKGKSVREVVRETGISYRRVAEASKRIKEEDKEIDEVNKTLPLIKPENIVTETDNNTDNTSVTESDNAVDNSSDNDKENEVTEEEFNRRLAEERAKWEQEHAQAHTRAVKQEHQLEISNNLDYEKACAYQRLNGLAGLKKAATKHAIDVYFEHKEKFKQLYGNEPGMNFAYSLDDYIDKVREFPDKTE